MAYIISIESIIFSQSVNLQIVPLYVIEIVSTLFITCLFTNIKNISPSAPTWCSFFFSLILHQSVSVISCLNQYFLQSNTNIIQELAISSIILSTTNSLSHTAAHSNPSHSSADAALTSPL